MGYFRELLATNPEVQASIRPLLQLSRETIVRLQRTEYALVSSLSRDPLLAELGHEVLVANARELRAISASDRKNDKADAEKLGPVLN